MSGGSHGRDGIANLVCDAGSDAADRGETLPRRDLARQLARALAGRGKPLPGFVQCRNHAVEHALGAHDIADLPTLPATGERELKAESAFAADGGRKGPSSPAAPTGPASVCRSCAKSRPRMAARPG
jgi:hypothetical protein